MRTFVVVPAYNEAKTVAGVVRGLLPSGARVIVVDDGSVDGTAAVAEEAGAVVVRHVLNRGQGAALKTGTLMALDDGADIVVHFDADGQHDPDALRNLAAPIEDGRADVVYGSRFLGIEAEGMPIGRRVLLTLARQFNAFFLGVPRRFTDPQSGLRAMSAAAARTIDFRQDRMAHCSEMLRLVTRSPFRWLEVPVRVKYSRETLAKGNRASDAFGIVWQLILGSLQR